MMMKGHLTIMLGALGILVGVLAQRSRMCFVAGLRNYVLVKDKELLFGLFSFLITIWLLTSLLYSLDLLRKGIPEYGDVVVRTSIENPPMNIMALKNVKHMSILGRQHLLSLLNTFMLVSIFGGLGLGLISTLVGGCVLRQHVLFAQGNMNALFYLLGFYSAVLIYYRFLFKFFVRLY